MKETQNTCNGFDLALDICHPLFETVYLEYQPGRSPWSCLGDVFRMSAKESYRSLLSMVIGLILAALVFRAEWLLYGAAAIGLPAVLSPWLARRLAGGLAWLHEQAGKGLNLLLLSLVYLVVLLPLSLGYRLFSRRRSPFGSREADSYYVLREHRYTAADLRRPW
ncbi:MAG: hypothetical protein D6722_20815 [Bacteroidetes bacterium]|nr:MAG: hypothetical protein D6722_20815 [Bacteroidota bacterium]